MNSRVEEERINVRKDRIEEVGAQPSRLLLLELIASNQVLLRLVQKLNSQGTFSESPLWLVPNR